MFYNGFNLKNYCFARSIIEQLFFNFRQIVVQLTPWNVTGLSKECNKSTTIVDWVRIETLFMRNYPVGNSAEGNEAYPSLLLMKCLLLQQWFRIDSDPELETQINDRSSFNSISKSFMI